MYHKDLLGCFADYCCIFGSCCKPEANDAPQIDHKLAPGAAADECSESSSGDGNKYNPNGHRRRPSPVDPPPIVAIPNIDAIANGHLSVEHAIVAQQKLSKERSHQSNASHRSNRSNRSKNGKRPRVSSNASKGSSKVSPLSKDGDHNNIPQFFAEAPVNSPAPQHPLQHHNSANPKQLSKHHRHSNKEKEQLPPARPDLVQQISREEIQAARKEQSKQLKRRVYSNLINNMKHPDGEPASNPTSYNYKHLNVNSNDEDLSAMMDDIGSAGMSDSVYFENEWYDESVPKEKCPLNADGKRHSVFEQNVVVNDEPLDEVVDEIKAEANGEERSRRKRVRKRKVLHKADSNMSATLPSAQTESQTVTDDMDDDEYGDEESDGDEMAYSD
eukprot:CAMPEP_0197032636 /NCGR_PEP_ID=MMETSP1384-20130603/11265_1 /TAXON_ID=29189 /ORGANISM="Ammonia sp." /LENGTH=386 /DNA_ID=CAMNT_0042462327 /DNA_START=550 /DNA_END=1710 /DNA_ORIENTATION=+